MTRKGGSALPEDTVPGGRKGQADFGGPRLAWRRWERDAEWATANTLRYLLATKPRRVIERKLVGL